MVTVTPSTAAFAVFNAVTVIVEVDPSDLTVVGDAKRSREAAVTVVVVAVVAPPPPPPQPTSSATAAANKNDVENLVILLLKKRFDTYASQFTLSEQLMTILRKYNSHFYTSPKSLPVG